jgi:CDGSH-type Zn-finger protein
MWCGRGDAQQVEPFADGVDGKAGFDGDRSAECEQRVRVVHGGLVGEAA